MDDKIVDNSAPAEAKTMGVKVFLTYRAELKACAPGISDDQVNMIAAHLAAAEVGAMLGVTMMRQPAVAVPGLQNPKMGFQRG